MTLTTRIHILSPGFTTPNSTAFLCPLIKFKRSLRDVGFDLRIFYEMDAAITDCDYLFIESKVFKNEWIPRFDQAIERIAALGEQTKVIWCDQGDSSGTFLGQVVPHVHRYLKAQLLRDRREYMKEHYASRIFADYYHHRYGVIDEDDYIRQPVRDVYDLEKLDVSWHSGMMHYGFMGPYLQRLREKLPFNSLLGFAKPLREASAARPMDITCRMGIPYARASMRFQRERMRDILKEHIPTDKLSRGAYFDELAQSKICVSPFGLGEITLKDFECFLSGAMLFKPDMSHMECWPNVFEKDVTYLSHDWDLETVEERIEWAMRNETNRIEIAHEGQKRYCAHTIDKGAGEIFADNFQKLAGRF